MISSGKNASSHLRSRASAAATSSANRTTATADNAAGATSLDPDDRNAFNARLSMQRQQRREARFHRSASGSSYGRRNNSGSAYFSYSKFSNGNSSVVWILRFILLFSCSLVTLWIFAISYLATSNTTGRSGSTGSSFFSFMNSKPKDLSKIDMRELNYELPFDNPDGGAWKQGWNVQPVPVGKKLEEIKIFVVPHSHCDPGWIKTFDEYFQSETKEILSTVIAALIKDPRRKFIWAEISYFEWWWKEQDETTQHWVRKLLHNGQFEFVTGGWVQPDEANTQLYAMEIQLQEGHDFIRKTFGHDHYIPKFGWSIDPFGYSPTMAYLLKKYHFKGMLIQRVHYAVKRELAKNKQLEFLWRQTWDKPDPETGEYKHDIFTHLMPFYSYDVPHTCGPDPAVCCQFDFARMLYLDYAASCPWGRNPKEIDDYNVKDRAMLLLDQYLKKAALYRSRVVLAPLGDDFRYRNLEEADAQFDNYQRIFDYINANVDGVLIQFGTLKDYFTAAMGKFEPPVLKGSFFTYSDRDEDYWSGYFTSRIFDKALDRKLERVLFAASSMGASKLELQQPRRALSLFQHHDGVTGTAKTHVVRDYAKRIHDAIHFTQDWIIERIISKKFGNKKVIESNGADDLQACWQSDSPRGMSINMCTSSKAVILYNPLQTEQSCGTTVVAGRSVSEARLPCEVPGALPESRAGIQFDRRTGLMTHPIKEQWMVWKVQRGGAYLFFPGRLEKFGDNDVTIEQGGYVVETKYWKRTVVEKPIPTGVNATQATILDFVYETFLQKANQEWFVRFTGDIVNNGVFHTDLNGFNFDTHYFRKDLPIQSQVFPMPTLASIEDSKKRMTILSEHAQGTASLQDGSIDVWLDRRLKQDDNRGLFQGVADNVPTRTRLRAVVEAREARQPDSRQLKSRQLDSHKRSEFKITPLCRRMWKELNHPLEMFGWPDELLAFHHDGEVDEADDMKGALQAALSRRSRSSLKSFIPFVYMVYNRVDYLKRSIDTLRKSDFPRDRVPIIISHDGHIEDMVSYVETLKSEFLVIQLFHPYACSEHPNTFPGDDPKLNKGYKGDTYGNPREGKVTCCKHHFTWMMNEVFGLDEVKKADSFLFLEEDYVVAPSIYRTIESGLQLLKESKDEHFGLTFDPTEGFSQKLKAELSHYWKDGVFRSGPMLFNRIIYEKIKTNAKQFCTFDDYNWDWSLVHLMVEKGIPGKVLMPNIPQVAHIGLKGGIHGDNGVEQVANSILHVKDHLSSFHGKSVWKEDFMRTGYNSKGYGGWGHSKDHEHCMSLFGSGSMRTGWLHFLGFG